MDVSARLATCAAEFIPDRLYFLSLRYSDQLKVSSRLHFFSIDEELVYEGFLDDFGPLNISMLYRYCVKLNKKLKSLPLADVKIVHVAAGDCRKKLNAAYLIGCYSIIYLKFSPEKAFDVLCAKAAQPLAQFQDASVGESMYTLSLLDCFKAVQKAHNLGFFSFDSFDYEEYEHYERVKNGDLNWIIPDKFIAFCGPLNRPRIKHGYRHHSPETYFEYFRKNNVTTIVRLNEKMYDPTKFVEAGFDHKDLFFIDGSTPSDAILQQFIAVCEKADGAIAVHCKAGLGRTGSVIGCYIMKHYEMTAAEAIAWIRICRPGSIIGHQQEWLESKQKQLWREGAAYRKKLGMSGPMVHTRGIYALDSGDVGPAKPDVSRISTKVGTMKLSDLDERNSYNAGGGKEAMTQGDKLNHIKAMRKHTRSVVLISQNANEKVHIVAPVKSTKQSVMAAKSVASQQLIGKRENLKQAQENLCVNRQPNRRVYARKAVVQSAAPAVGVDMARRRGLKEVAATAGAVATKQAGDAGAAPGGDAATPKVRRMTKLLLRTKRTMPERCSRPCGTKLLKRSQLFPEAPVAEGARARKQVTRFVAGAAKKTTPAGQEGKAARPVSL